MIRVITNKQEYPVFLMEQPSIPICLSVCHSLHFFYVSGTEFSVEHSLFHAFLTAVLGGPWSHPLSTEGIEGQLFDHSHVCSHYDSQG
jgi:hypothetical protein